MTYLTQSKTSNYSGKRIKANSFKEAESLCPNNFEVVGQLIKETNFSPLEWVGVNYNHSK